VEQTWAGNGIQQSDDLVGEPEGVGRVRHALMTAGPYMLKVLARNLDGTSQRYKGAEVVNAQVSGLDGREGGPSVKPSA